jgi:hypothetical protein
MTDQILTHEFYIKVFDTTGKRFLNIDDAWCITSDGKLAWWDESGGWMVERNQERYQITIEVKKQ